MSIHCSLGHENPDGSVFCDECGERLTPASASTPGAVAAPPDPPSVIPTAQPLAAPVAPRLVIEADNTSFDLAGKSEIVIGREDSVSNIYPDIDLTPHGGEEGGVSRLHAKIYLQGNQYLVEDQNSTNYTFVNRQKLAAKTPTPINDGDELRLGRVVMVFHTA
jgi:pSer/pThr/pTyr-binding forkhead associated (FHA) protein